MGKVSSTVVSRNSGEPSHQARAIAGMLSSPPAISNRRLVEVLFVSVIVLLVLVGQPRS
jgi:hypothetical protein